MICCDNLEEEPRLFGGRTIESEVKWRFNLYRNSPSIISTNTSDSKDDYDLVIIATTVVEMVMIP